jgi:hypothetical protein
MEYDTYNYWITLDLEDPKRYQFQKLFLNPVTEKKNPVN